MSPKPLVEDVAVDAAEVERTRRAAEIEAERLLRVGDAFHQEHPKVSRSAIQPVREGDSYIVVLDDLHFKLLLLSPEKVAIGRVDPKNHDILLEPAQSVRLPQAPLPPLPPDLVSVAHSHRRLVTDALDHLRRDVATWEDLVSPAHEPLSRLRAQYPGLTPIPNGQVYNDPGLCELAHAILRVAQLRQTVVDLVTLDRRLVVEASAAIRAAILSTSPPPRASIRTAGEIVAPLRTQVEVNLDAVQAQIDTLDRALVELKPTIQTLIDTTPNYLVAALQVLREGRAACCALYLEKARGYLCALRDYRPEAEATAAVDALARDLGCKLAAPTLTWSSNLLDPPTLT
jgi:hypothetical protein